MQIEITSDYLSAQGLSRSTVNRFWKHVQKTDSCWLWIGSKNRDGYGHMTARSRMTMLAHRVCWLIHFGPIPKALCVLHRCDCPACVRPDHLFLGTPKDNAQDRDSKGRTGKNTGAKGSRHSMAKITEEQILEIRNAYQHGGVFQRQLAEKFHLTQSHVSDIVNRKTWTHI